jgi:hypothetical protein
MNNRGRTYKRSSMPIDVSGNYTVNVHEQNNAFLKFLDKKSEDVYTRPWHRLEAGVRLNRLRLFAKQEAETLSLDERDQTALFSLLQRALDKKLLNSKTTVVYDQEQQKILEIKGLTFHRGADGRMQFQISERKSGVTLKKKRDADDSVAAPV